MLVYLIIAILFGLLYHFAPSVLRHSLVPFVNVRTGMAAEKLVEYLEVLVGEVGFWEKKKVVTFIKRTIMALIALLWPLTVAAGIFRIVTKHDAKAKAAQEKRDKEEYEKYKRAEARNE